MTPEDREAAAAVIVEGERAVAKPAELHVRLRPCFGRVEPHVQARKYIAALMSDLPHMNGWTIAEHAGDVTPDRTQRLLNHAVWDTAEAMVVVRRFVAGHLADELVVGALDESGQQKQGDATAGVKRQYMGCAGRVANGVNTVSCSYASGLRQRHTPGQHRSRAQPQDRRYTCRTPRLARGSPTAAKHSSRALPPQVTHATGRPGRATPRSRPPQRRHPARA